MKCKHKWDYLEIARIGKSLVMIERIRYATWMCAKCGETLKRRLKYQ